MKILLLLLIGTFGWPDGGLQSPTTINTITKAIGGGDAVTVAGFIDSELELSILDEENIYGKEAASKALDSFFKKFEPTAFNQRHQGSSKADDAEYVIGNLTTRNGSFRIYIYVAKKGDRLVLQELRVEKN